MFYNSAGGNDQSVAPGTYTTVSQTTINCPVATCTLGLSAMQEIVAAGSPAPGEWRIVVLVGNTNVDSGPWQGFEPSAGDYVTGNWQGSYSVPEGSHVVSFQVYGQTPFLLGQWANTVTVTTP